MESAGTLLDSSFADSDGDMCEPLYSHAIDVAATRLGLENVGTVDQLMDWWGNTD